MTKANEADQLTLRSGGGPSDRKLIKSWVFADTAKGVRGCVVPGVFLPNRASSSSEVFAISSRSMSFDDTGMNFRLRIENVSEVCEARRSRVKGGDGVAPFPLPFTFRSGREGFFTMPRAAEGGWEAEEERVRKTLGDAVTGVTGAELFLPIGGLPGLLSSSSSAIKSTGRSALGLAGVRGRGGGL
jgi:hypothetical protein